MDVEDSSDDKYVSVDFIRSGGNGVVVVALVVVASPGAWEAMVSQD